MRKLNFIGVVRTGTGRSARDIVLPGREDLMLAPADWPNQLVPGTLNVEVNDAGFPEGWDAIGHGEGMNRLDDGKFRPVLVIPQGKITGNPLEADPDHPTRGSALVWPAELRVIATGRTRPCWLFRRIGSEITSQIELVAQEHLRSCLNLTDGTGVKVTIREAESEWTPPTPEEIMADWCQAARRVEENFGCEKALGYLIGEKFLRFLEVAEADGAWRRAVPAFAAEIRAMFEPGRLAEFLNTPRRLGALGHASSEPGHRALRASMGESERIREDARNLMLLEWAKELLLEADE